MLPDIGVAAQTIEPPTESQLVTTRSVLSELSSVGSVAQDIMADFGDSLTMTDMIGGAGGIYKAFEKAAERAVSDVEKLENTYAQYKAGILRRNLYSGQRRDVIKAMDKKLGFFREAVFQGNPLDKPMASRKIFRFSTSGKGPSSAMVAGTARLSNAVSRLRFSGGILNIASAPVTYMQYRAVESDREKFSILMDFAGSAVGGLAAGAVVAAMATPVGWVGVAGVAVVGMAGGAIGGWGAQALGDLALFDKDGQARVQRNLQ